MSAGEAQGDSKMPAISPILKISEEEAEKRRRDVLHEKFPGCHRQNWDEVDGPKLYKKKVDTIKS